MKTPRGEQINIKIEQLKDRFKNYLSPIFEEWTRVVPLLIQEKLMQPLFTINENNTLGLNFSEEVIIFCLQSIIIIHYLFLLFLFTTKSWMPQLKKPDT